MTVLLRSRSLMRGVFHHHHQRVEADKAPRDACVITHSTSAATLADWDWEEDDDEARRAGGRPSPSARLPPLVDDCTDLDRARRVEIASSRGHAYDEADGVRSILAALTPRERARLADERMPLRHYRAEKGNLPEAVRKIRSTLRWREEFGVDDVRRCFERAPDGSSGGGRRALADVVARENETGKIYCRGYDRWGRAILYLTPGRENSTDEMNNMRHLVYHLERAIACTRRKSGRGKICIVIGYQGFRLSNAPPMSTVKHTLEILQGHYPERMHRAYICDPPLVFRSFWGIIKHFVDPSTLEKIAFCTGRDGRAILERDFDTSTTERQAGGTNRLREYDSREFLFETPFDCTFDE